MVLRDSFMSERKSKIVMIACINPGSSSADHTINTLRYAIRLKQESNSVYKNPSKVGYLPQHQQNNVVQDIQPQPINDNKVPKPQAAPTNPLKPAAAAEKPPVQSNNKPEERKRGGWGAKDPEMKKNPSSNSKDPAGRKEKANMMVKKPSTFDNNTNDDKNDELSSPDNKKKKQDDWNYLK